MIPSCNISDIYYMVTTHKWMGAERHKVYIEAADYAHDSWFVFMGMAEHKELNGMVGLGHMYSYCAAHVLNGEENSLFNHK